MRAGGGGGSIGSRGRGRGVACSAGMDPRPKIEEQLMLTNDEARMIELSAPGTTDPSARMPKSVRYPKSPRFLTHLNASTALNGTMSTPSTSPARRVTRTYGSSGGSVTVVLPRKRFVIVVHFIIV